MGSAEGWALPPESAVWREADEIIERGDPLEIAILGIQAELLSWSSEEINAIPDIKLSAEKRRDRNDVQRWLSAELRGFFYELKRTKRLCEFITGAGDTCAHRIAPLGEGYALYESGRLQPRHRLLLDYCEEHRVPQGADYDKVPGLMSDQQIYMGDTQSGVAVSLSQAATALAAGGGMRIL